MSVSDGKNDSRAARHLSLQGQPVALGLCSALWLLTAPAFAQAPAEEDDALNEVVVSGSRVIVDGYQAPTPVTVVTAEQLTTAAPSSLIDALNQIPQFSGSTQPQSTGVGTTGNAGRSYLSLRNMGPSRTLVLIDGRRLVGSTPTGTADASLVPENLVERVDVVTGGASAAYGSDAVTGVVNYVLNTRFTGVRSTIQGGITQQGDNEQYRVSLAGGLPVGSAGHLIAAAEWYVTDGVETYESRDWFDSCARIANPAVPGNFILRCNVHSAGFTGGGMIGTGPLAGTHFGVGGVPLPFSYGTERSGEQTMVGGGGAGVSDYPHPDVGAYFQPVPAVRRINGFMHYDHEFGDNFSMFFEGLRSQASAQYNSTAPWQGQASSGYNIQRDNAFLDASLRQRMVAANITSFRMNRYDYDFGLLDVHSQNDTSALTLGFKASAGAWNLDGFVQTGQNKYYQSTHNNPLVNREYQAADAVRTADGSRIVCRSTLTNPNDGCVPINLFGYGSPSQAALDYILGVSEEWLTVEQDVAEVTAARDLWTLPAGTIRMAVGAGYRKESSVRNVDPDSAAVKHFTGGYLGFPTGLEGQIGGFDRGNPQAINGEFDVVEAFAEFAVPLLSGKPWAQALDLNAAVRHTDYSTSGGVTSWKLGLTYEPIADSGLRLRAARSRDIRAANVNELFLAGTQGQGNQVDLFQPVNSPDRNPIVFTRSFGNPDLTPEIADTLTLGLVYQPTWFTGFGVSLDYFNIQIEDAIGTLGATQTILECFNGATQLCSQLIRDPEGRLIAVHTPFLNIADSAVKGFDFEMNYRRAIGPGDLSTRLLATYVPDRYTQNLGAPRVNQAGNLAEPKLQGLISAQYRMGEASVTLQERYYGATMLANTLTPAQLAPELNRVSRVFYTDLTLNYGDPSRWQAFVSVNNLFDKEPPRVYNNYFVFGTSGGGTSAFYDIIGRTYTSGVRLRF